VVNGTSFGVIFRAHYPLEVPIRFRNSCTGHWV